MSTCVCAQLACTPGSPAGRPCHLITPCLTPEGAERPATPGEPLHRGGSESGHHTWLRARCRHVHLTRAPQQGLTQGWPTWPQCSVSPYSAPCSRVADSGGCWSLSGTLRRRARCAAPSPSTDVGLAPAPVSTTSPSPTCVPLTRRSHRRRPMRRSQSAARVRNLVPFHVPGGGDSLLTENGGHGEGRGPWQDLNLGVPINHCRRGRPSHDTPQAGSLFSSPFRSRPPKPAVLRSCLAPVRHLVSPAATPQF